MNQQLDHGVLNIPLAKRGNIDAQIDAYKARQAKEAKAAARTKAQQTAADRIVAKQVLADMPAEQLARIAAKASLTVAQARAELKSLAYFTPTRVIALKASA